MKKTLMMTVMALAVVTAPAMANTKDMDKKIDEKFSKYDTNGDGSISASEKEAAADDKFAEADMNNDGSITKAELKAHWEDKKADKAE